MRLHDLTERDGPFTSVYLPIDPSTGVASERLAPHWGSVRRDLEEQGADRSVLDLVERTVLDLSDSPASGVAVVVDGNGDSLVQLSDEAPERAIGRWGDVPSLSMLIRWRRADVPHLVVVADREGADIWVRDSRGQLPGDPRREVDGDTEHIHRGHAGGWSQRRFQQRSENTWERNAAGVAEEIHQLAEKVGAELIVATGDVRALGFLDEHLPPASKDRLRVVEAGGRSDPDAATRVAEEADHLVSDLVARRSVDAMERFAVARGNDLAVEGPGPTLEALSASRVDLLLVHDDPDDERTAHSGAAGVPVAAERHTIVDLGEEPEAGRLVDVAVRAALLTGADVEIVPAHGPNVPEGGIGGVLRG